MAGAPNRNIVGSVGPDGGYAFPVPGRYQVRFLTGIAYGDCFISPVSGSVGANLSTRNYYDPGVRIVIRRGERVWVNVSGAPSGATGGFNGGGAGGGSGSSGGYGASDLRIGDASDTAHRLAVAGGYGGFGNGEPGAPNPGAGAIPNLIDADGVANGSTGGQSYWTDGYGTTFYSYGGGGGTNTAGGAGGTGASGVAGSAGSSAQGGAGALQSSACGGGGGGGYYGGGGGEALSNFGGGGGGSGSTNLALSYRTYVDSEYASGNGYPFTNNSIDFYFQPNVEGTRTPNARRRMR